MLRAVVWRVRHDRAQATRVAHRAGRALSGALVGLAVLASACGDAAVTLWAGLVGLAVYFVGGSGKAPRDGFSQPAG